MLQRTYTFDVHTGKRQSKKRVGGGKEGGKEYETEQNAALYLWLGCSLTYEKHFSVFYSEITCMEFNGSFFQFQVSMFRIVAQSQPLTNLAMVVNECLVESLRLVKKYYAVSN